MFEQVNLPELSPATEPPSESIIKNETILVDIKGAVVRPGVYTLSVNERVVDAIAKAGGYTEDANASLLNLAQKLTDEMVIYVPVQGEELPSIESVQAISTWSSGSEASDGKVRLNKASETELTTLPGIGPSKAKAILEYREQHGGFKSIEELKKISGIGDKTFEKLKDYVDI